MFWGLKNTVVWADMWEQALSWWRMSSFVPDCLKDNLQTNDCVPLRINCSSGMVAKVQFSEKKKQFDSSSNTYTGNCCLLSDWYVNPLFIICHEIIDVLQSTPIVFFEYFLLPIDTSLFFRTIDTLCGI